MAAAAFGVFALGAKTHDEKGKLTTKGRIALAGILSAGLFAVGLSVYDFSAEQVRVRQERLASQKLLSSVKRGLYPLTGMRTTVTLSLTKDFPGLLPYKKWLKTQFIRNDDCRTRGSRQSCGALYSADSERPSQYVIAIDSSLVPKNSVLYFLLKSLYIRFQFFRTNDNYATFVPYGRDFKLDWRDGLPSSTTFTWYVKDDVFQIRAQDVPLRGPLPFTGDIYSLTDTMPGMISAYVAVNASAVCDQFYDAYDNFKRCRPEVITPMLKGISLAAFVAFPFPQSIDLTWSATACPYRGADVLTAVLPDDVDSSALFTGIAADSKRAPDKIRAICNAIATRYTNDYSFHSDAEADH